MSFSRGSVLTSFFWKLLERFGNQGGTFIISIVLARLLSPHEYGLIAILNVFIFIAAVFVDGGFTSALIQKKEVDKKDFSTVFVISCIVSVSLYIILFLCSPIIASFYHNQQLVILLRVLAISLLFDPFNAMQVATVTRRIEFKKLFFSSLISLLFSGCVGIIMAYKGLGVWALIAQSLAGKLISIGVLWLMVDWRPSFSFSKERFKSLFGFGGKILATNVLNKAFTSIRGLIIGKMYNPTTLALYDKGVSLPSLIRNNITGAVQTVLFPVLSSVQDDIADVKSKVRKSIKLVNFFLFPLFVGFFVVAKSVIILLFTEKWVGAVPFVRIFCTAELLMSVQTVNLQAIISLGYSNITLKLESFKKIIEFIILVVSCFLGVYAIAIGTIVYNMICLIINLAPSKRLINYPIREQLVDLLPNFMIAVIMGVIVYFVGLIPAPSVAPLLIQIIVGGITYIVLCKVFNLEIYNYVISIIKEYKRK